jgi:hypothetical protein
MTRASCLFLERDRAANREGIVIEGISWQQEDDLRRSKTGDRAQYCGQRSRKTSGHGWLQNSCFPFALLPLLVLLSSPLQAREDSARLVFQKTAGDDKSRIHVVKKGESIRSILRRQPGYEPVSRAVIRRLNPDIPDLNRVYPGQSIVLPVPGNSEPSDPISYNREEKLSPESTYRIREGDSISRIILSELNVNPADVLPAYRLIRKLNPEIKDLNRIQAGQTLRLPPSPSAPLPDTPPPDPLKTTLRTAEKFDTKAATTKALAADDLLGTIRPVINRMRGAVTATGSYFIPLQETTQITIDCSLIPVVELDDGTTVLLDYGNRLSESLKELIRQSWKNYAFLTAEELRGGVEGLQGIIGHSRHYRMARADKPLTLTEKPEILAFPDWVITGKETAGGAAYLHGLFLLGRDERPLPVDARVSLEKSGVAVTEIAGGRAVSSPETPPAALRPVTADLRGLKGIALAEQLLALVGEKTVRNAEVVVFDQARNGFNLSVTADLLVRKGEKRFILHTKKLPEQFVQVLQETGTGVIPIGEKDQGRPLIEGALQGLGIPVSFGHFSFRIPEEGKPRLTASFSALRAMNKGEPIYLIDFDLPPAVLPFLNGRRGERVVQY